MKKDAAFQQHILFQMFLTFEPEIFNEQKETNNGDKNAFLHFFFILKNERKTQDEECFFSRNATRQWLLNI